MSARPYSTVAASGATSIMAVIVLARSKGNAGRWLAFEPVFIVFRSGDRPTRPMDLQDP